MLQRNKNWGMVREIEKKPEGKADMRQAISCFIGTTVILVLGAVSLRYVTGFWLPSLLYSLQIHIGAVAIVASLLALAIGRSRLILLVVIWAVAITGHGVYMKVASFAPSITVTTNAVPLRLISFNVLAGNVGNGARIADMIVNSGADLVYVMEAGPVTANNKMLVGTYPYRLGCGNVEASCDIVVYSRYPLANQRALTLNGMGDTRALMATIDVGGTSVTLVAAHIAKPYFDNYHKAELEALGDVLSETDGPVIVGGDFNADMIERDLQRFLRRTDLTRSGIEPATWPVEAGRLGISIDHIFVSKHIVPTSLTRIEDNMGSNHFGIVADLRIPEP